MNLSKPELETVLRCVDKVFDFSAERDRLRNLIATLESENKGLATRITELESDAKQAADDEAWAKQNLAYVSMSEDGCWAGMYDRDSGEERGLVERVNTITEALSALRDMVEGGRQ